MRLRRRFSADARIAADDTERVLVSALQEGDTPAELIHDEIVGDETDGTLADGLSPRQRRTAVLAAGSLALLTVLVVRRRR